MTTEKIDSHHHFWRYRPEHYGWIDDRMSALRRDFLPEDLKATIVGTGVTGVISVQARQTLEETWDLLRFAGDQDFIRGVVGWVPLAGPDLNRLLPAIAEPPKLKGVRHVLQDEEDPYYMLRDDFNRGIAALRPFHLVYDILIYERHLPQTVEFVDRHPDQKFVLDHIAKPRIRDRALSPWRENICELARRPNVSCKISGMVTEADWASWSPETLQPYFDVVLGCFGPKRLMFGSDWPVCLVASSYPRCVEVVSSAISPLSVDEQDRIWSGTAVEVYGLG